MVEEIVKDYTGGLGIEGICEKYHIGKLKVKKILKDSGIEIRKKGKQALDTSGYIVSDYRTKKFVERDGFHFVAIDKISGVSYNDYMNEGGFLTTHIKKEYGVEIPSLYNRRKYYMETGNYWWEQWFNIVEKKDEENIVKCRYCNWTTSDVSNKSGALTHHIIHEHNITIKEHLKNHPEDYHLFKKQAAKIEKENKLNDKDNYVICPICGKKLNKITYSHLRNMHKMGMTEFKKKYPNAQIMSKTAIEQASEDFKKCNLVVSKNRFISSYEQDIRGFLDGLNVEYDANRQILIGKEIDILIPSVNIGIEFDGLKWHTEFFGHKPHMYHLEKTKQCNEKGYGLIHIFEDEYVNHRSVVLSKIKHIIGMDADLPKIQGRKVEVKEILSIDAMAFLEEHHIQGFYKSSVYLGGFYEGRLIAVMSFKNGNIKNPSWELTRFATDFNFVCQGVGGKMFSYFIKKYEPDMIVSFADKRWTINKETNLYTKLGFKLESETRPDYKYYNEKVDKYRRFHKMALSKAKLHQKYGFPMTMTELEMARELGYDRIWDCGLFKYVWRKSEIENGGV